jgi:hypothetical protein
LPDKIKCNSKNGDLGCRFFIFNLNLCIGKFSKLKSGELNMSTMNISLPEPLKNFVDERVANAGYGTSSEY